jgi:hypothetical protein
VAGEVGSCYGFHGFEPLYGTCGAFTTALNATRLGLVANLAWTRNRTACILERWHVSCQVSWPAVWGRRRLTLQAMLCGLCTCASRDCTLAVLLPAFYSSVNAPAVPLIVGAVLRASCLFIVISFTRLF